MKLSNVTQEELDYLNAEELKTHELKVLHAPVTEDEFLGDDVLDNYDEYFAEPNPLDYQTMSYFLYS